MLVLDRVGELLDLIGLDLDADLVESLAQLFGDGAFGRAVLPRGDAVDDQLDGLELGVVWRVCLIVVFLCTQR